MDRLRKEQLFHDQRFGYDDQTRQPAKKFYVVNQHVRHRYYELACLYGRKKDVLEYGCGTGGSLKLWRRCGVQSYTGIDISPRGIEKARGHARALDMAAQLLVMNAERTAFVDNSFDLVAGTGILHHLDLSAAYHELQRILRPDGHALFIEPLGHNPIINWYRGRTPTMRTEDEHPLKRDDLKLLDQFFQQVHLEFFSFFTLVAVPLRHTPLFTSIYAVMQKVDQIILRRAWGHRMAWIVMIHAHRPKK